MPTKVQLGANVTAYGIDAALKPFYGDRPWGVNVFLRFRLKPGANQVTKEVNQMEKT